MKKFKKVLNIFLDLLIFILSPIFFISKMISSESVYKFLNSKKYIIYIITIFLSLTLFLLLYFLY